MRWHLLAPIVAAMLIGTSARAATDAITGMVTRVQSGDTLFVDAGGRETEIRLADIGAPQGSEYYAPGARTLLESMVTRGPVRIDVTGRDGAGRAFGRVFAGELDVNRELVRRGAAWVCWNYAADTDLLPYENGAKRYRRGLWSHTWEINAHADCRRRPPALAPVGGAWLDPTRMSPHFAERANDELSLMAEIAVAAARDALLHAGRTAADIDAVICAAANMQCAYPAMAI